MFASHNTYLAPSVSGSYIYLDATLSPEMLLDMLGTDADQNTTNILHIKQEMPSYKNLLLVRFPWMGRLSADRRESADERVAAVLAELEQRHPGIAVIDWKSSFTNEKHGYHFRDGRGVNRFKDASAMAIVGTPTPNIGAMAIKYQLLKNKPAIEGSPEFRAFVDEHIQSELIQEIGRARANQRTEQVPVYILNDYSLDFHYSSFPDATIEQVDAFSVNPSAGEKLQRTKYAILKAFLYLIESGTDCTKITQDAIANVSQITRSRISQIASEFGGWSRLRKMLILLYRNLYNKTNNPQTVAQTEQEPDSDLLWLAHEYLPLLAINPEDSPPDHVVKQILEVIQVEGEERFKIAIQSTDKETKLGILGHLTALLTTDFAEEGEVLGG